MIFQSPWGKVLECETLSESIYYIITAIHSGLAIHNSLCSKLSPEAQNMGIWIAPYLFFEKDLAIHYPNVELDLKIFPKVESISIILKSNPNYQGIKLRLEEKEAALEFALEEEKEKELAILEKTGNYITSIVELNEGWKITTAEDREYLSLEYPNLKTLDPATLIGEVTNFYKLSPKIVPAELVPPIIIDRLPNRPRLQILAQASKEKNSYILELYTTSEDTLFGEYLCEINLVHFPKVLNWWCHE